MFPSKRKGTVSAKLNVKSKDVMCVLGPDFWPKHVRCRAWLTQKRFQKDTLQGSRHATVAAGPGKNAKLLIWPKKAIQ